MPSTELEEQFAQALIAATKAGKLDWQPYREKDASVTFKERWNFVFVYDDAAFTLRINYAQLLIGRSEELRDLVLEKVGVLRKREKELAEALSFLQALAEQVADADACAEKMLEEVA